MERERASWSEPGTADKAQLAGDLEHGALRQLREEVSILVLLEAALQPGSSAIAPARASGFNPCSSGSRPSAVTTAAVQKWEQGFQSLFFWKPPFSPVVDCRDP